MCDQIDIVLVGADWLDGRSDGYRPLQTDRDRREQRVIRPGKPLSDAFVPFLRNLVVRVGQLERLADDLENADKLCVAQFLSRIDIHHCSATVFRLDSPAYILHVASTRPSHLVMPAKLAISDSIIFVRNGILRRHVNVKPWMT
jgi:hypothetical protein